MKTSFRRSVGRGSFAAALAVTLPLVFAVPVQGAGLTQGPSQTQGTNWQSNLGVMAQTFTAPADAQLDHVKLQIYTSYSPFTVEIRHVTSNGWPDLIGAPLASTSNPGYLAYGWHDFSFGAAGVALSKGVQYAIVVTVPFGVVVWYDISTAPDSSVFSGGQSWVSGCVGCYWLSGGQYGADFNFETWLLTNTAPTTPPTVAVDSKNGVTVNEGTAPTMTGTFSAPSGPVTLKADSGTITPTSGTGSGAWTWTGSGSDEPGGLQVKVTVTDGQGLSNSVSFTVTVIDVNPTAKIDGILPADPWLANPLIITPQGNLNFTGSFTDPGAQDTHTFLWDFGDGATATTLSTSHFYASAGTYKVTLTVTDDDPSAGSATAEVTVQTTQQSLSSIIAYVQSLTTLNNGQKNSLIAKLKAASDSIAHGDSKTAHNQLSAFLNELQVYYNSSKVSTEAYNTLRADVHAVESSLGTYNRFLEWWPFAA